MKINIVDIIEEGGDVRLAGDWEYERFELYQGVEPGVILGVYRLSGDDGYRLIAHDRYGNVVHADGKPGNAVSSLLELVPVKRKFLITVRRTLVQDAEVEIEAANEDVAMEEVCEVAEDNRYDLDWEEYSSEYEVQRVIRVID